MYAPDERVAGDLDWYLLTSIRPINDTRDTDIVGVGPTTQEKLHINVSQGPGCVQEWLSKNGYGCWGLDYRLYRLYRASDYKVLARV